MAYIEKLKSEDVSRGITWINDVPLTSVAVHILAKKINEIVDVVNTLAEQKDGE